VDLCCLTDFHALIETRGLDGHGIYYYVPGLLKHFTTAEINELIVPRPHLALAGNYDRLTPPAGLDRIDAALRGAYRKAGAADAWRLSRYDCGHMETAAMRAEIIAFLNALACIPSHPSWLTYLASATTWSGSMGSRFFLLLADLPSVTLLSKICLSFCENRWITSGAVPMMRNVASSNRGALIANAGTFMAYFLRLCRG
jgi:hypothetical protein